MCEHWNECATLARGNPFYWRWSEDDALLTRRGPDLPVVGHFQRAEYEAMIRRVNENGAAGTPLGSRPDGNVPDDSIGALLTRIRGGDSAIRPLCAHLAAVAYSSGLLTYEDRGRGAGRGLWLYPAEC